MKSQTLKLPDIHGEIFNTFAKHLKNGAVAVIPTDTIYGIVGPAKNPSVVEKIYRLRKRASSKPMIILAASIDQIKDLGVKINLKQAGILNKLWPDKISVVIDCKLKKLHYLHRGKNSLALRIPDNKFLRDLLKITGPLVAPSANFEGEKPSEDISDAKQYFKDNIDFYIDGGKLKSIPSTVAKIEKLNLAVLREGAVKIPKEFLK